MLRLVIAGIAAAFAASTTHAWAHVGLQPDNGTAGSVLETVLVIPHGCGAAATTAVRVKIPPGVSAVEAQVKPGWTVQVKTRSPQPTGRDGKEPNGVEVDEVEWHGGTLPPDAPETFGFRMRLPDLPGLTLFLPTVQECGPVAERWIDVPTAGQRYETLRNPAPRIRLVPKSP